MKPKGLFSKLLLSHAVIIITTLVILGGIFNYLLQTYLADRLEQQLQRNARTLAANPLVQETIALSALDVLDNLVTQVSQSIDANVIIVDTAGNILASTAGLKGEPLNTQEVRDVLANRIYSRWGGAFLGVPSLTVGYPIKINDTIIGALFLDTSVKGFQANLFRFRLFILYAALLSLILAALLAFFLARSISRPILEMSKSAESLARGERTRQVSYQGEDELGLLVSVFNQSVTAIQNTLAQQQQLDEQRRQFIANVSHEFRAPVSSLQGFLELMQDGVIQDPDRPKYYNLMLKDTARLNRLVSDLLELARFQAGQAGINPLPLAPGPLIQEIITKLTPRAQDKEIVIHSEIAPEQPPIMADSDRLEQILINLLDNALRFTPKKGWIKVSLKPGPAVTRFLVQDSGNGIPAEDLPYVFERFYKVDKARTPDNGGTGLGLAIVKELVKAHGGEIWVTSHPGNGTSFTFTIPNARG